MYMSYNGCFGFSVVNMRTMFTGKSTMKNTAIMASHSR